MASAKHVMIRGLVFLTVIGVILGIVNVAIVSTIAAKASTALSAAPALFDEYVKTHAESFVAESIRKNVPGAVQSALLATAMSMGAPESESEASEPPMATDAYYRSSKKNTCGIRSNSLIYAFERTCTNFQTCRTQRTQDDCAMFVNDLTVACDALRCDVFDDKELCQRIVTMCSDRVRAFLNEEVRQQMQRELGVLCQTLDACTTA